jgi:hypothetical protein
MYNIWYSPHCPFGHRASSPHTSGGTNCQHSPLNTWADGLPYFGTLLSSSPPLCSCGWASGLAKHRVRFSNRAVYAAEINSCSWFPTPHLSSTIGNRNCSETPGREPVPVPSSLSPWSALSPASSSCTFELLYVTVCVKLTEVSATHWPPFRVKAGVLFLSSASSCPASPCACSPSRLSLYDCGSALWLLWKDGPATKATKRKTPRRMAVR